MAKMWKMRKQYLQRTTDKDALLLALCASAAGILWGLSKPKKKKAKAGRRAAGMLTLASAPLIWKFRRISRELAEDME